MSNRYTGDISGISEHFQFQDVKKKDGTPMTSFSDWVGVIKHMIDNTKRKDNREKIIENPILKNELIGDWKGLLSKYERCVELEKRQNEINKQAGHHKKEILIDKGRGRFIPARTGVIQLTLDPRDPKNTKAILKWKEQVTKLIQDTYGPNTPIAFHFNETSAGAHFIKDWVKEDLEDKVWIDKKDRMKYINTTKNSNEIIDKFHKDNKWIVDELGKEFDLKVVDGPVTNYSIKRKEKDFVKVAEKIEKGEKLGWKDRRILRKFCEENKIDLGKKTVIEVEDHSKTAEGKKKVIAKLYFQLLERFEKDWDEEQVKKWKEMNHSSAIVNMIQEDMKLTKETDERNYQLVDENKKLQKQNERLKKLNKQKTITETKYETITKWKEKIVSDPQDKKEISRLNVVIKQKDKIIQEQEKEIEDLQPYKDFYEELQKKQQKSKTR